jgi:DNA topoisomerase-1
MPSAISVACPRRLASRDRSAQELPLMTTSDREAVQDTLAPVGLHYTTDSKPGITRVRRGKGFSYHRANGEVLRNERDLRRIRALAIPPAWTDVWISPDPQGHLQATGRDARGRKQHRYHDRWREVRDQAKYDHVIAFAEALPHIRRRVDADLRRHGLPREKVLATVVRLLETSLIRVGNDASAAENASFGLTTLRRRHVDVDGANMRFHFTGKSGKEWDLSIRDRRIARVVKQCSELPGYEIFKYQDEHGELVDVTSTDVNAYLREISGGDFTARDFRTWAGTVLAATALHACQQAPTSTEAKHQVVQAIEQVARDLGNTPAVCRACYVHPAILEAHLDGVLADRLRGTITATVKQRYEHLSPEEVQVLTMLRDRLDPES